MMSLFVVSAPWMILGLTMARPARPLTAGKCLNILARTDESSAEAQGQYTEAGAACSRRAADLNRAAYCSVRQHGVWRTFTRSTAAAFIALHDYSLLVRCC